MTSLSVGTSQSQPWGAQPDPPINLSRSWGFQLNRSLACEVGSSARRRERKLCPPSFPAFCRSHTKRQFTFGPRVGPYLEKVMTAAIGAADQGIIKWPGKHRRLLNCRLAWKSTCTPARRASSLDSIRRIEHGVSFLVASLPEQAVKKPALNSVSGAQPLSPPAACAQFAPGLSAERAEQQQTRGHRLPPRSHQWPADAEFAKGCPCPRFRRRCCRC
jgi:hypothetical protein